MRVSRVCDPFHDVQERAAGGNKHVEVVESITIDDLLREKHALCVKLDLEGSEWYALAGALQVRRYTVDPFVCLAPSQSFKEKRVLRILTIIFTDSACADILTGTERYS